MEKINHVLDLCLLAAESQSPLLFHCAQGKDRTGIIALLIELIIRRELVNREESSDNDARLLSENGIREAIRNYCLTEDLLPIGMARKSIIAVQASKSNLPITAYNEQYKQPKSREARMKEIMLESKAFAQGSDAVASIDKKTEDYQLEGKMSTGKEIPEETQRLASLSG